MDHQFIIDEIHVAFDSDSLNSSWSLDHDANTPEELQNKYGIISYNKGASVIRMFNHTLGDEVFTAAIRRYIKEKYGKTISKGILKLQCEFFYI